MSAATRKKYEKTIEAALEGTSFHLERWLPQIEETLKRTRQEKATGLDVAFRWKQDGEEGLVLEVSCKPVLPGESKTYKASLEGGQLDLFKAPKA